MAPPSSMRRVKKACVSSSAIPSWWSTQPSRVTLMLKVKSPMAANLLGRAEAIQSAGNALALALGGREATPPDPSDARLDRLLDRRPARVHECLDDGPSAEVEQPVLVGVTSVIRHLVCPTAGRSPAAA